MPTVPKTSRELILAASRQIVERDGVVGLSMQAVAAAVGVQAPSLYKHVANRSELLRGVVQSVLAEMRSLLENAANTGALASDLRAMAFAQRAFALRSPHLYALVFEARHGEAELPHKEYEDVVVPLISRLEQMVPPEQVLSSARLLVAFTHGFLAMELTGVFRLGGDLETAFAFGIDRVIAALGKPDL